MRSAGFVLAGGRSSRLGEDKALLPYRGAPLICHVAEAVRSAADSVAIIGPASRYSSLGYAVVEDVILGLGPIGGILTALRTSGAGLNLVVACDMPGVTVAFLTELLAVAESRNAGCVVPVSADDQKHPLCAVYQRRVLPAVEAAIESRQLKMQDLIAGLDTVYWAVSDPGTLANVNSREDWVRHA